MDSRVWAIPVPPVGDGDLTGLIDFARGLGVDLRTIGAAGGTAPDAPGKAALAAVKLENGLWLFCIAGNDSWPLEDDASASFALHCRAVFAWPRDHDLVGSWLSGAAAPTVRRERARHGQAARAGRAAEAAGAQPCGQAGHVEQAFRQIGLIGRSPRFREALGLAVRLARFDVPVLLEGETGTGKELFARALHYLGPRRSRPFVPLNCGALPDSLLESQLFGHLRGVFTDARSEMRGLVAQAEGGTLFFDEVHCLSPKGQTALLRFVQDQLYRPLGAEQLRRADVRIVTATNCSLAHEVEEGRFREDLYYRLDVAGLRLPPLRERREDIPLLAEEAVARLCARFGTGPRHFDAASLAWLATRDWRGNVRELENYVCREFLLSDDDMIHLGPHGGRTALATGRAGQHEASCAAYKAARAQVLADFETRYLRTMLALTRGNVTEAARQAGKERRVFGRLMRKYGIDRREFG